MLKAVFLVSIAATIALAALHAMGYAVLDFVIAMVVVSFLSLGAYTELENKKIIKETKEFMGMKLEGIEKVCNETLAHLKSAAPEVDSKMATHKSEVNFLLDRMARKSLEIEERLNAFGKILSSNLGMSEGDSKECDEQEEENPAELEYETEIVPEIVSEKAEQESYSTGEIIYVDEE